MRLLNYLLTVFSRKQRKVEVVRIESNSLRLNEWRTHSELISAANAVWNNSDFRLMLQVAQNESPANFAVLVGDVETRALHQARTEGYNLMLANLKAMRIPADKQEELETTYEPEETNQ